MKLLVKNISSLMGIHPAGTARLRGEAMNAVPCLENAWLLVEDERIKDFGSMDNCHAEADEVIDAGGDCQAITREQTGCHHPISVFSSLDPASTS